MPKHMEESKKWQLFLQTIMADEAIRVESVNEDEVIFQIDNIAKLQKIRALLSSPVQLRENIIHAVAKDKEKLKAAENQNLTKLEHKLNEILKLSAKEIITKICSESFLKEVNILPDSFINDEDTKSASLEIKMDNSLRLKRFKADVEILKSAFSYPKQLSEIILGNAEKITHEHDDPTAFSQKVISFTEDSPSSGTLKVNYGLIIQSIQSQLTTFNTSPLICAAGKIDNPLSFSISRQFLLGYLYITINSGVFFKPVGHFLLQPILYQPYRNFEKASKTLFQILLDTSGSMKTDFDKYIANVKSTIKQILEHTDNWEIDIWEFNEHINKYNFSSEKDDYDSIISRLNSFKADGYTQLHSTMLQSIEILRNKQKDLPNSVLLVFTDGKDEIPECNTNITEEEVVDKCNQISKENPQFSMFSMGYGSKYNASFFSKIADQSGFTHIHLENLDQMEQFEQYLRTIRNTKVIYEFLTEAKSFIERCPAGDIAVAQQLVRKSTQVTMRANSYSIGTEVTPPSERISYVQKEIERSNGNQQGDNRAVVGGSHTAALQTVTIAENTRSCP